MATPAQIQAQGDSANTMHVYHILQSMVVDATYDEHYVVGIVAPYQGKARWILTTTAETAANQNTEIIAGLNA